MKLFHARFFKEGFWIRIGPWKDERVGKGISVMWGKPLFSHRNGYTKHWKIGKIRITILPEIVYKDRP